MPKAVFAMYNHWLSNEIMKRKADGEQLKHVNYTNATPTAAVVLRCC